MGWVVDATGRRRKLHALLVTLSFSRHLFVYPTWEQTTQAVIQGLDAAWAFFDGAVQRIVPDNMTAVVLRASPTEPELNCSFREYADVRGLLVDPARVRKPQDKGRVENQVPYVRERWFAGENFPGDIALLREHAQRWCREVAGTRVHGTCCRASWLMGDGIGSLMAIKEVRDSRPADDGRGQSGGARGDRRDRRLWAAACGWTGKQAAFRQRPALQTAGGG